MVSNYGVYVDMGECKISKTSIYTDCLASCHCLLIDGLYADIPFVFMNHNSFGVVANRTSNNLKLLLGSLVAKLKKTLPKISKSTIDMINLKDLRLLVCGATVSLADHEREAYSLLINPSQYIRDRLVSILNDECIYLFHQLINRTVIIKSVICEPSDIDEDDAKLQAKKIIDGYGLRVYYDCHVKKGLIVIEWNSEVTDAHGDLAYMKFNIFSEKENEYQFNILQNQITNIKNKINAENEELKHLNNALLLIPSHSFFISSSSKKFIYSSESHAHIDEDEIIQFRLILSENNCDAEFSPKFLYRIFDQKEKLLDYENLQINIYCFLPSLDFCLHIDCDKIINPDHDPRFEFNDIIASLNQWLPSSTTTNLDLFATKIKSGNGFLPFGEQVLTYKLKEEDSDPYFIYRIDQKNLCNNGEFFDWYAHLRTFLVFFIDIVLSVVQNDSHWISYIISKQYQNDNGNTCYAPIGFTTIYLPYAFPDKKRARISEMLIFPPYQRKGHGRRLLTMIYDDLKNNSDVQDITVVNPSNELVALHDLVSFDLCYKYLYDLFSEESINKTNRITQEMIDKAQNICKLTEKQTRRLYEMYLLRSIDQNNNEQMKRFRLIIKQRLFDEIQYNQHPDHQLRNLEVRKIYLTTQYENVLQHYKHILTTFDNHYRD